MTDTTQWHSESIDLIAAALVNVLPELAQLAKDKEGKISLKNGGSYSYNYADLKQLLDMAKPKLKEHDIVLLQPTGQASGGARVHTILLHSSGQWIRDEGLMIPANASDPKTYGSAVSYGRRYALASMLGIAQADDDATSASAPKEKKAAGKTVKLAQKKVRDQLQVDIESLPQFYASQIGARLREQKVVWSKLDEAMATTVAEWIEECRSLPVPEGHE